MWPTWVAVDDVTCRLQGGRPHLPGRFAVPDRGLWQSGYAAEAGRSLLPMARTLDEAIATVTPFLDPLLAGTARDRWDPQNARWTS